MNKSLQTLIVSFAGVGSATLTAALFSFIELKWNLALYSYTFWFVIPVGAICVGMIAASGVMGAARLINARPNKAVFGVIIVTSLSMFFGIQWFDYSQMSVDGKAVSAVVSFSEFLSYTLSHTSMKLGYRGHFSGDNIELGSGGYFFAIVQILGFTFGGVSMYLILAGMTYCERCGKYFTRKGFNSVTTGRLKTCRKR